MGEEMTEEKISTEEEESEDKVVITAIQEYKKEAEEARKSRIEKNKQNMDAYLGIQNLEDKAEGQSQEFIPKVAMAVEQTTSFIKKAMVDFGEWFSVTLSKDSPIKEHKVTNYISSLLEHQMDFSSKMADGIKVGLLKSLIILKVYPRKKTKKKFVVQIDMQPQTTMDGLEEIAEMVPVEELIEESFDYDEVQVDIVDPRGYYPDPTGNGLYEIHETTSDLFKIKELAEGEDSIYDKSVVDQLVDDNIAEEEKFEKAKDANQDEATPPAFRKKVIITEFWGDILDSKGKVIHKNVVAAMANGKYLIRKPTPNPRWDGESPFAQAPLVRVPFSVWHKALYDHVVDLNFALNDLFNLMLDGGMASVWGINQLRTNDLVNPADVSNGIPQGTTLQVKDSLPDGTKVFERVSTGNVPPEALAMYNIVDKEHQAASLVNDIKMGMLPAKQVKATEVIESTQQSASFFEGIIKDLEQKLISKVLTKIWNTILQVKHVDEDMLIDYMGKEEAAIFLEMSPKKRFATFSGSKFKVFGLSAVLSRIKDFQKLMALMQAAMGNPMLFQAFVKKYSPDKIIKQIIKTLNINPSTIELDKQEKEELPQNMQELPAFQEMLNGGKASAKGNGDSSMSSDINQAEKPSGFTGTSEETQ